MRLYKITYTSHIGYGRGWPLSDEDWMTLQETGWDVNWFEPKLGSRIDGQLAVSATKVFETACPTKAIELAGLRIEEALKVDNIHGNLMWEHA